MDEKAIGKMKNKQNFKSLSFESADFIGGFRTNTKQLHKIKKSVLLSHAVNITSVRTLHQC